MNCMAAYFYLQGRGVASFGKRFASRINYAITRDSPLSPTCLSRRAVHGSVYDKNPEDQIVPTVVPDSVIPPQSEEYWTPHPQTGVFGPAMEQNPPARGERGFQASAATVTEDSVLEQKAFFRPLEDLEKPPPQP